MTLRQLCLKRCVRREPQKSQSTTANNNMGDERYFVATAVDYDIPTNKSAWLVSHLSGSAGTRSARLLRRGNRAGRRGAWAASSRSVPAPQRRARTLAESPPPLKKKHRVHYTASSSVLKRDVLFTWSNRMIHSFSLEIVMVGDNCRCSAICTGGQCCDRAAAMTCDPQQKKFT